MANFISLKTTEQLTELLESSRQKPVILFKHSTTCPISSSVYHEVSNVDVDVNLLIVQSSRQLSSEIAERVNIRHESPQVIVIKDGAAIYHASHFDITSEDINGAIE